MPDMESDFFTFTMFLCMFLALHASIDFLCTIGTLFHIQRLSCFTSLYPSMFIHSYVREDALVGRLLAYTVAAMSLVRVMAVIVPHNQPTMILVAVMYCLEALICMYELDTAKTAHESIASRGACSATVMACLAIAHASIGYIID